jgi:hypothetical protein
MPCHSEWPGEICSGHGICRLPDRLLNVTSSLINTDDYYCECTSEWSGASDFLYRDGTDCTEKKIILTIMHTIILVMSGILTLMGLYMLLRYANPPSPYARRGSGKCVRKFPLWYHPFRLRLLVTSSATLTLLTSALRLWNVIITTLLLPMASIFASLLI